MIEIVAVAVLSYLAGSLPTSVIVGRLFFGKDPRNYGSGNAGGTNSFRLFGWKAGIVVIAVDVGKGAAASLLIAQLALNGPLPYPLVQLVAGICAVVGHIWTLFAGFRGGKGVGTAAGMLLGLYPLPFLCGAVAFVIAVALTGWISAGSIAGAVVFPVSAWILSALGISLSPFLLWLSIPTALLILFTHRANIRRISQGTENRFPKLMLLRRRRPAL